jgi:surface protein G
MKKKNSLTLDDEFIKYCEINQITDIEGTAKKIFQRGFTIEKYGETPTTAKGRDVEVIKEVIKEVPVEKIVEVIKTIEIIKEVPVEKIVEVIKEVPVKVKGEKQVIIKEVIKEVPVEKIIINDEELKRLSEENESLKNELSKITVALEKMNKAKYLKGSDLNNLYDE